MSYVNKAHTATANRIARRYGTRYNHGDGPDIQCAGFVIEVETMATLEQRVEILKNLDGQVYIAVTNKEAVPEAIALVQNTRLGIMDPQGNIIIAAREA